MKDAKEEDRQLFTFEHRPISLRNRIRLWFSGVWWAICTKPDTTYSVEVPAKPGDSFQFYRIPFTIAEFKTTYIRSTNQQNEQAEEQDE